MGSCVYKATALLLISGLFAGPAAAQDQCNDVLKDGPYAHERYKDDSHFNQIVWSRFLKSTYQSAKTDRAGGFGIPVGEIVLGANFSEQQYNAKKAQIQNEYFNQITSSREIDVALMSGDTEVLNAWTSCMRNRGGGLTIRFDPVSARDVFMHIEYFNQGTRNKDKLASDIALSPDVKVISGAQCLRKGRTYVNGKECIVGLQLPGALSTMQVVADAENSIAKAWLPARIELNRESKPYPFVDKDRLYDRARKRTSEHRRDIQLTEQQIKDGWNFDTSTARTGLHVISVRNGKNKCHREWSAPGPLTFSYGYHIYAGNRRHRGSGPSGHIECAMNPYILMRRDVWVGMTDAAEDGSPLQLAATQGGPISQALEKVLSASDDDSQVSDLGDHGSPLSSVDAYWELRSVIEDRAYENSKSDSIESVSERRSVFGND